MLNAGMFCTEVTTDFLCAAHIVHLIPVYFNTEIILQINAILGAFAELRQATISIVMSVCPTVHRHGATRLTLDGFSFNLIFEYFSRIFLEISILLKSDKYNGNFT
jgi:hypothetical protein